jgi:hypothetical protein
MRENPRPFSLLAALMLTLGTILLRKIVQRRAPLPEVKAKARAASEASERL